MQGATGRAPAIHARDFTFRPSRAQDAVLAHLTFDVPASEFLLVAGPTGSGKSLFLNLLAGLAGLYPAPEARGELAVRYPDSPAPRTRSDDAPLLPAPRPDRVALVMQRPRDGLVGLDVLTALALPLEEQGVAPGETKSRLEAALAEFDVLPLAERDVATLSGGEARRVALAGAIAQDAALLLLDEPFADLDPQGTLALQNDLARLAGSRTIVVAEHRTELLAKIATRTLHLVSARGAAPPMGAPAVPKPVRPPRLEVAGLRLERGGRNLLARASFALGPGVHALMGPNGAGKTTLLETLAGLAAPRRGTVTLCGDPVWRDGARPRGAVRRERALRRDLQVAFQDPYDAFFAATVQAELAAPRVALGLARRTAAQRDATQALKEAGLLGLAERAPMRLSAGEARSVQTLGVLHVAPRVLFLDEPATGLDAVHRMRLRERLADCATAGLLVLVATHETSILPPQTRILHMPGDGTIEWAAPTLGGVIG